MLAQQTDAYNQWRARLAAYIADVDEVALDTLRNQLSAFEKEGVPLNNPAIRLLRHQVNDADRLSSSTYDATRYHIRMMLKTPPSPYTLLADWEYDLPLTFNIDLNVYQESYAWAYDHTIGADRNAEPQPYLTNDDLPTLAWGWLDRDTGDFALAFWHESRCEVCQKSKA